MNNVDELYYLNEIQNEVSLVKEVARLIWTAVCYKRAICLLSNDKKIFAACIEDNLRLRI